MNDVRRLPAEWEPQDAVLMAWPHAHSDWSTILTEARETFARIAAAVTRFERLVLVVHPDDEPDGIAQMVTDAGGNPFRLHPVPLPTDDTWTRDCGPITVVTGSGPCLLDFGFNGWGLKFRAFHDNQLTRRLVDAGILAPKSQTVGMILEGGSIDTDGAGTILTTTACLLHPNRNPHLSREEIEGELCRMLGTHRILWLSRGHLEGDDTDAHVDTLARFVSPDTICHVCCDDPRDPHHPELAAMRRELESFRTPDGTPYRLVPLPLPSPILDREGHRLPATHANFLVIDGAVLVPTYDDPTDQVALERIATLFPDREVLGIDCRTLILQHGSLHCVTMQLPRGTFPCNPSESR